MIPAKVLAHITAVEFGEVSAVDMGHEWWVTDRRGRRHSRVVAEGLSFELAVIKAYSVSTRPAPSGSPER